jgi:transposase-like protein
MPRPTKLSPAVRARIVQAIRAGNYGEIACRSAGISPSTYYRWLARGEREQLGPYAEFAAAVRLAEAEAEVYAVATIRQAMPSDWRAALTYLERRHPGRWRRQTSTELTGRDGGPIETTHATRLDLSQLTDEQLELLAQINRDAPDPDRS